MGLFGGKRSAQVAPPSTTRAHATTSHQPQLAQKHYEELLSPKSGSGSSSLPLLNPLEAVKRSPSPLPFDLHSAIEAMQVEDDQTGHLPDMIDKTAAYLGSLLKEEDVFNTKRELPSEITTEDIRTLYIRAVAFANAKMDIGLRISAIRLLAALITTYPPVYFATNEDVVLPDIINVNTIYRLITAPHNAAPSATHVEAVNVEVGAVKALTKNGVQVQGLDGLVGWLVRSLTGLSDEFAAYCARRDDWDKVSTFTLLVSEYPLTTRNETPAIRSLPL